MQHQKQGFKVTERVGDGNQIVQKLVEVTGLSNDTIRFYLHDKFKQANPWEGSHAIPTPLLEKAEKALGEEGLKKLDCNGYVTTA